MKAMVILILLISLITTVSAQVKTGGGGGPDIDTQDGRRLEYEKNKKLSYAFSDLNKELGRIEIQCQFRKTIPKDYTFVDSFYTLTMKKTGSALIDSDCIPSKSVSECLQTKEMGEILKEIATVDSASKLKFLEKEYKLDKKSAEIMLKFFTSPSAP